MLLLRIHFRDGSTCSWLRKTAPFFPSAVCSHGHDLEKKKKWLQKKKIWEILDPSSAKNLQNTMYLAFPHHSIQPHKYGCAFHGIIHSQAFHMTAKRPQLNEQNIVPLSSHSSRNSSCIHSQQRHTLSVYGPVSSFLSRENCDV